MDMREPSAVISPTLDGPVLAVLANVTRPLAAREVARLARRGSWEGIRRTLQRLSEQGIVEVEEVGNSTLYTLNRQHLAFPAVEVLTRLREALMDRLSDALNGWPIPPVHASLFGSAARGDGDTSSDVDLFLVRPRRVAEDDPSWRSQIDRLAEQVREWTGNHLGLSEINQAELTRVAKTAAGRNIRKDGITIAGKPVEKVLRTAA